MTKSENLELYESFRSVPENAKKEIKGGRLSGKTDINPMWRIKKLTEQFGPCGIGWGYTIERMWIEDGTNGERCAMVLIGLWYRINGEKSDPVPGIGGNMLVAKEKNGMYTSDECFKMALTDAISVAAKALGIGADVYWSADGQSKYDRPKENANPSPDPAEILCDECGKKVTPVNYGGKVYRPTLWCASTKRATGKNLCGECYEKLAKKKPEDNKE